MTTEPHDLDDGITAEEAAEIKRNVAQEQALRALVADALTVLALIRPADINHLRNTARHCRTGAELGVFEENPFLDLVAFHSERHALLEHACAAVGMPHKAADVLEWQPRSCPTGAPRHGPGEVVPFVPRYARA